MTARVKVLCLIDSNGKYSACGYSKPDGTPADMDNCRDITDLSLDEMAPVTRYVWLTADVILPEVPVVAAEAVPLESHP